ncbi:hypothetical protein SOPEG_0674 [Candidatus Sodalis pierantonius str. SOPE]|uniref:Uncharacterized protein n=1 Tax=Candidatus Sodalis pierantonii str. SOPE TaxID=2342 RepID=W0HLX1_9GAMM|nr:hypothetical protein SOPEG_0674 [Candidatus Sodalis pierantonius str. SOPE]
MRALSPQVRAVNGEGFGGRGGAWLATAATGSRGRLRVTGDEGDCLDGYAPAAVSRCGLRNRRGGEPDCVAGCLAVAASCWAFLLGRDGAGVSRVVTLASATSIRKGRGDAGGVLLAAVAGRNNFACLTPLGSDVSGARAAGDASSDETAGVSCRIGFIIGIPVGRPKTLGDSVTASREGSAGKRCERIPAPLFF